MDRVVCMAANLMTPAQLQRFRETRLKMTRAELAKALDVDPHHIYMLEAGKRRITKILELAVRYLDRPKGKVCG